MDSKQILLVANDFAPSSIFEKLVRELPRHLNENTEIKTRIFLHKDSEEISPALIEEVLKSSFVLMGMSSTPELARYEILAARTARENSIPFGFFADIFNVFARSWFESFMDSGPLLFVINEEEKQKAQGKYPNAKVVNSGNPCWEDFCYPKYTRESVRQTLGIPDDRIMILSPGTKSPVVNILLWGAITEVLSKKSAGEYDLIISPHPGDKTPPEIYSDIVELGNARVVTREKFSTSAMLSGADIVIESASAIGVEAAHLRKPVINFFSEIALRNLEKITGSREWELCKMGCSSKATKVTELEFFISHLPETLAHAYRQQELKYPLLERGQASRKVAEALKEFVF